jgi:hypothetical protein
MIFRSFFRLAARASLIALATASVAVGCSRQGEGERCDSAAAGNDDCDSGLVCTICAKLAQHQVDRCCPPGGSSDPRCEFATKEDDSQCILQLGTGGTGGTNDGGAGKAGSAGSSAGSAGASSGGAGSGGTAGTAGAASGGTAGEEDPAGAGGA